MPPRRASGSGAAASSSSSNNAPVAAPPKGGANSRLDRLVTLLDTGSTSAVRSLAARQLAQIAGMRVGRGDGALAGTSSSSAAARANLAAASSTADTSCAYRGTEGEWPEALHLLHRIMPLLRSTSWETRIAAGSAIEQICAACGVWDPLAAELVDEKKDFSAATPVTAPADLMTFASFSPQTVLSKGEKLLSSAGSEYDASSSLSVAERLASAKQDMKKLGLGAMAGEDLDLGLDVEQELMSSEASTSVKAENKAPAVPPPISPAAPEPAAADEIDLSKLSARERNQLKRKRKTAPPGSSHDSPRAPESKTRVLDAASPTSASSPSGAQRTQTASWSGKMAPPKADGASVDHSALATSEQTWPFDLFSKVLLADLFSPKWEIRHGAALGLRSLISTQGSGGGMSSAPTVSREGNVQLHAAWCADMSIRLLAVLCLDRLGDFVFDQVVTPVRETAAQALASLLKSMPEAEALATHAALVDMVRQDWVVTEAGQQADVKPSSSLAACRRYKGYAWEVRHAGLLGLKWLLSVRADLLQGSSDAMSDEKTNAHPTALLRDSVELAICNLRDEDDDVRHVAAQVLIPAVEHLVGGMTAELASVLSQLWSCLEDLKDDLASSIGGVMNLLAQLVQHQNVIDQLTAPTAPPLSSLIPRLFPFFRHTITSVRLSVLSALCVFLEHPSLPRDWIDASLMRLLFQNLIVEEKPPIRELSAKAWKLALGSGDVALSQVLGPHIERLFRILMTPLGSPFDFTLFYEATRSSKQSHNIDKHVLAQDLTLIGVDTVIRGRIGAAEALGDAMALWTTDDDSSLFERLLTEYISSPAALRRCLAAVTIQRWAEASRDRGVVLAQTSATAQALAAQLISILESPTPATYTEMAVMLQRIQADCQALYSTAARDLKIARASVPELPSKVDATGSSADAFTIETAKHVAGAGLDALLALSSLSKAKLESGTAAAEDRRHRLVVAIGFYATQKEQQDNQLLASVAGSVVALGTLPAKLNPVIRSLMNAVKFEENLELQTRAAASVVSLLKLCSEPGARTNPSDKIVKNLCAFVCQDTSHTPIFDHTKTRLEGILSHDEPPAAAPARGRARQEEAPETDEMRQSKLIRRGAEVALGTLATRFGPALLDVVPSLWTCSTAALLEAFGTSAPMPEALGQGVLDACTLIQVVLPSLDASLQERASALLDPLSRAVQSPLAVVRSAAAKSLSTMADCMPEVTMRHIVQAILPLVADMRNVHHRQGAIEVLSQLVRRLDMKLLPYVIVLIVPVLGRMSDSDDAVRSVATHTFASLVKMIPLEAGLPDPPGLSQELMQRRETDRSFLAQLLDGSKVEPYEMPVKINAELRSYQRDGVSWMAFLAKFQLHGILCDDMGLGKTLQSISILSAQHFERAQRYAANATPDNAPLPSLIVCPPTLTGHWFHEIKQYSTNLKPLLYIGQPNERARLAKQIEHHDAVIASYDAVRSDIAVLSKVHWHYCILDEGHIIKSGKTKTTQAVKQIRAHHRLLLSGTPIQNNVLELWSLFDFLMPGFLGTERAFNERFGKPISNTRDGKSNAKEQEAAALALEALHKQVLPFLLRRLKDDVLDDLPPKIIQDIECELGPVQKQLYDDYSRSQKREELETALDGHNGADSASAGATHHVFQELQYLRKLVNHPRLVFDPTRPKHREIEQQLAKSGGSLRDIAHAPKLTALRQLLHDCGIGLASSGEGASSLAVEAEAAVAQHRVLIFCQVKQMLDIIEHDLFRSHMPDVTYMRLDGGVPAEKRHGIVQTFNADPSIDVLLLTTQIGGLGLTLTGADTVIFVEHDWNPSKDLQAMDRAHRLGQKKVVNVYRLITRDTLEAKIMGLQRFKLNVANSVVTQQNAGLESMETDQVLDLFGSGAAPGEDSKVARSGGKGISQKALLAAIEAAPDTGDDYAAGGDWKA